MTFRRKTIWKMGFRSIGIILFGIILWHLDLSLVLKSLTSLHPPYILAYAALFVVAMFARIYRLCSALNIQGYPLGIKQGYRYVVEACFLGTVTPARAGEFIKIGFLKKHNIPLSTIIFTVLLERIYDLAFYLLAAILGGFYFILNYFPNLLFMVWIIGAIILFSVAVVIKFKHYLKTFFFRLCDGFFLRFIPEACEREKGWSEKEISQLLLPTWKVMTGYSTLCLICNITQTFFLALALNITVPFLFVGFAYATSSLISLLPLSISGLGTREATYVMLMGLESITPEKATLFSLLDGVVFALIAIFLMVIPVWLSSIGNQKQVHHKKRLKSNN